MLSEPTGSDVVVQIAVPLAASTLLQPVMVLLPFQNWTMPVVAPAEPVISAVNVTLSPWVDGFFELETVTVGFTGAGALTTCEMAPEVAAE